MIYEFNDAKPQIINSLIRNFPKSLPEQHKGG